MAVKEKETETVNISEERQKALKIAIDKIEKDFGKGSIMRLGDKPAVNVETIPQSAKCSLSQILLILRTLLNSPVTKVSPLAYVLRLSINGIAC